jgi:hypothetical protein
MDTRGWPRLPIPVMLNAVKHLSGGGGRKILHFVQDDHWVGNGRARAVGITARGRLPRFSYNNWFTR